MRIIAGQFKGRKLKTLSGRHTRPTTDKIKESIFQRIGPFFSGGSCLDLFAGSGALGIEALSRGIDRSVFVDNHRQAIQTIRHNLRLLKLEKGQTKVLPLDAFRAIRLLNKQSAVFTLIFLDPPYERIKFSKLLKKVVENKLLACDGLIVCEHQANDDLPKQVENLVLFKQFSYGKTTNITLYKYKSRSEVNCEG